MSNSKPGNTVPLTVRAADEGTEIFLIDSGFNRLQSAVGRLETKVRPGIYKVRFRAGETQTDRIIEVTDAARGVLGSVEVLEAPLRFASAAPIPGTRTTHEYHEAAWRRAWQPPDVSRGHGASLFLMARDSEALHGVYSPRRPWAGIALADIGGKVLCDMSEDGWRDDHAGVAAMNIELDPGVYVLRVNTSVAGVRKMAVAVCPGWQTQVLLAAVQYRRSGKNGPRNVRRASLSDAAVFMVKPDVAEMPQEFMEKQFRFTELARQGLAQGRAPIRPSDLQDMLYAKFENPMLGIIGTHLLLRAPEPDMTMLDNVVGNLERIVPGHPDVLALRLAVNSRRNAEMANIPPCTVPPMLSASWQIIVEQSIKRPHMVPPGSLADRIGYGHLGGAPWLVWRRERPPTPSHETDALECELLPSLPLPHLASTRHPALGRRDAEAILNHLSLANQALQSTGLMQEYSQQKTLPELLAAVHERFPMNNARGITDMYSFLSGTQRALVQEVAAQSVSGLPVSPDQIVQRLGVPATTVIGIAQGLLRRDSRIRTKMEQVKVSQEDEGPAPKATNIRDNGARSRGDRGQRGGRP